jgi:hypothetical protein
MAEKTPEEIEAEKLEAEKNKNKPKKVTFDADQTEYVNTIYTRAFGEGAAKSQKEWEEKLAAEKAERERLAAEKADLEKKLQAATTAPPKTEDPPKVTEIKLEDNPVFKQLQAQLDEFKGLFAGVKQERDELKAQTAKDRAERKKTRKKDQFLGALAKAKVDFFDPLEAYKLAEDDGLEYDDENDRVFVKNSATGQPKLNSDGEPMDAVDFVKDFAARKKYLVKAATQDGGLGHTSTDPTKDKKETKDYSKLTPEEFEAERQRILSQPRDR